MTAPGWFMIVQTVFFVGAIGWAWVRNWPIAWVWFCCGLANIGFVVVSLR